ncbi:M42 family metallopeptidase [Alicyclobacillus dauci]|uniref:M42 family metallopeptidase n=1 Tax=Alicyclobacillus dauci TaxID=1475485 RepID=A0ABY6YX22_9BACL|nr:M42 family metallopeptidase [Alicyclobacillus dauci]WAH35119.1 M42 family metallopeptidase [Alicyclobacillus dauci]
MTVERSVVMTGFKHLDTLKELVTLHGGPGFEHDVRARIEQAFRAYTDDIQVDTLGNLVGVIKGEGEGRRPRILLSAHMDEIALVVTHIEKGGFLRVAQAGGFDPRTLVGQEVFVHTKSGRLLGIVGSKPPHLTAPEERGKAAPLEDLFIDLATSEDHVRERVDVGDRVTLSRDVYDLQNDRIAGKSLDNRTSVAIILETLEVLKGLRHVADVYAVASVQEEVGVRGAATVAYGLNPDIAVAIDVTFGAFPGQASDEGFVLGGGPAISFGPNLHMKVFRHLTSVAEREGIAYQIELSQGPVGADARAFQIARAGIASALVGIPIRYMHTSVETGSYRDIVACARLLAHYIADVGGDTVEGLSCY